MPKVSIALTTYNHEKYLAAALDSIFNQNLDCVLEVVIGNDCSTDGTSKIIKDYQSKYPNIKVLKYDHNQGYTINFDKTLRACTGEYISIFDGDDIMLASKLKKQIEFLDSHQECVMVTHQNRAFDSSSGETIRLINPSKKKKFYTIEDLIQYGSIFGNSSKMFRKSAYPEEGIDYNIQHIADWFITMLIVKQGKIGYIDECLVDYRVHQESIMKKIRGDMHFIDKMYILNQLSLIFNNKYDSLFYNQEAYAYLIRGIYSYDQKEVKSARSDFMKSISKSPFYSLSAYIRLILTFFPRSLFNLIFKRGN